MPDQHEEIARELDQLVKDGESIRLSEWIRRQPEKERKRIEQSVEKSEGKGKGSRKGAAKGKAKASSSGESASEGLSLLKLIQDKDFGGPYQRWYSRALRAVEQLLPDRYAEFRELYRLDKKPKELDVITYTISDYIHGTTVTRGGVEVFDAAGVALTKSKDQIAILASARDRLDSLLADIEGTLEAALLDDELATARGLLKAKHLRSAGVIAGVVLERHLKTLVANHQITFRKKAQIGNLNDALKNAGVYDVPQWRQIQRLGDIRNLCGHDGERDPKADEVQELIDGASKIVATVF